MFAIIETGGQQFRVKEGDTLKVSRLVGLEPGKEIIFDKVLLTDNGQETKIGKPYLEGSKVEAKLIEEGRGRKIVIQKFKAKSNYRKKMGFRPYFSEVTITGIKA